MIRNEVVREMTFDEEYEILQEESRKLFEKEKEGSDPPLANCVVRRALRCIRKLYNEMQDYRALGTVEELRELTSKGYAYNQIAWERDIAIGQLKEIGCELGQKMDEIKEAVEKQRAKKPIMKLYFEDMEEEYLCCPACGEILTDRLPRNNKDFYFHCLNCGQKLDWSK